MSGGSRIDLRGYTLQHIIFACNLAVAKHSLHCHVNCGVNAYKFPVPPFQVDGCPSRIDFSL